MASERRRSSAVPGPATQETSSAKWNEALKVCRDTLSRQDLIYLDQIPTCDDLIRSLDKTPVAPSHLMRLRAPLESIKIFVTLLTFAVGTSVIQTAFVWGIFSLVLETAAQTERQLSEIVGMLDEIGRDLEIFQLYERAFGNDNMQTTRGDDLLDIFVEIITFWCSAISYLRRNKHDAVAQMTWPGFRNKFRDSSARIRTLSQRIKERVDALTATKPQIQADLLQELSRLGLLATAGKGAPHSAMEEAKSCHNIPAPKNPNFGGREVVLEHLRIQLPPSPSSLRSYALWGTGGIGKTQIALNYAYEAFEEHGMTVLWVDCETGLSTATSFRDLAIMLQLPGRREDDTSDVNRFAVLEWLRLAKTPWLLVLDNVEDIDLARQCWPVAVSGCILVTSRNPIVSVDPVANGEEVEFLDGQAGAKLIMKLIGRDKYSAEEQAGAIRLATKLDGLALALTTMAFQIKLRQKSIASFLDLYDRHAKTLHQEKRGLGLYYKHSLRTCWLTAFQYLSGTAASILGVCSMISADKIPEQLFQQEDDSTDHPEFVDFLYEEWAFENALDELFSSSLLRRDPGTNSLFMHRLIQEQFQEYMTPEFRKNSFRACSWMLRKKLPPYNNGITMRARWRHIQSYVQHVLVLATVEEKYKFSKDPGDLDDFEPLMCGVTWYLFESGKWPEAETAMRVALPICRDKNSLTYAAYLTARGCMEYERGHTDKSIGDLETSLEIREKLLPETHAEIANSKGNYANALSQLWREGTLERATVLSQESLRINEAAVKVDPEGSKGLLHIRHLNLARTLRLTKDYEQAFYHVEQARKHSIDFLGEYNHYEACADYYAGNIYWDMDDIDQAVKWWQRAYDFFVDENPKSPATSAAKLKLTWAAMKRGNPDEAIREIEKLLVVAKLNEAGKRDKGETARYLRSLANAYRLKGDEAKFEELRSTAEGYRREIQKERYDELPDEDQSYCLMTFCAFW